ncbi:MAG: alanine--tRNA ligase-related protein, partial [Acutalibacteraceae bacterium]
MERLYYENAYLTEFSAVVTQISENGIVLDKTAFFPEGGGQSSDRGTLSGVTVSDVQEKDGIIYHITNDTVPFCVGETVKGEIDFHKRFSDMQNHSGEHIVSGLIHSIFSFENVGFHLNDNEIALDFSGVIPNDKISEIELLAN